MRALAVTAALAVLALAAEAGAAPAPRPGPEAVAVGRIVASRAFKAAAQKLAADHERTVGDIVRLTEIPAPPFKEHARGEAYLQMLKAQGLTDVEMDAEGNVMGIRPGTRTRGKGPFVVMAAHQDTVFPEGTDVKVRREGDRLFAPGIGDDTRSLATLLAYMRALDAARIRTRARI
jgi:tripeptide aminopeptidase